MLSHLDDGLFFRVNEGKRILRYRENQDYSPLVLFRSNYEKKMTLTPPLRAYILIFNNLCSRPFFK